MKIFFVQVLFCLSIASHAQVNFFQTGARWGYLSTRQPEFPGDYYREWMDHYDITGDTTINSIQYKVLKNQGLELVYPGQGFPPNITPYDHEFYVRYDTLTQSVYMSGTPEILLLDFTLSLGDTVPNTVGADFVVDSIETINLFGHQLTKYYYTYDTMLFDTAQYVIEGLGSSNGIVRIQAPYISVSAQIHTSLVCFQLNSDVYPSGSVCDIFLSVGSTPSPESSFTISDNNSNSIRINTGDVQSGFLEIFDMTGRKLFSGEVVNGEVIPFQYASGLMVGRLTDGKTILSVKFFR